MAEDIMTADENVTDAAPVAAPATPNTALTPETTAPTTPPVSDWASARTKIAGADEKLLARLSRYGTMDEAIKAGLSAQDKLATTRSAAKPGKDATPDELAAYREANGIPESPDKYEFNLPNGIVLGEADKPYADAFTKVAHDLNLPADAVNKIAAVHLELREQEIQQRATADVQSKINCDAALRSADVWGSETNLNLNLIQGMLDGAPAGVKEQLIDARMADGTPLGNHIPTLQWLATMAREQNPMATVVPGSGANAQQALESEISKLEGMMADTSGEYWKGPNADKNQSRYRDLITARSAVTRR